MKTSWKAGLVIGAAVLATLAIGAVQTRADKDTPDLSGIWTLDASKSELPARRFEGRGGHWGGNGGGHWGGGGGNWQGRGGWGGQGGGAEGEGRPGGQGFRGRGGARLPRILHITQRSNAILFADSAGTAFQEILIGAGAAVPGDGAQNQNDDVRRLSGHWNGGTLNVERTSPLGVMLQTFKLEDHGKTLEVQMERKSSASAEPGGGPRRGFKMVYRRSA